MEKDSVDSEGGGAFQVFLPVIQKDCLFRLYAEGVEKLLVEGRGRFYQLMLPGKENTVHQFQKGQLSGGSLVDQIPVVGKYIRGRIPGLSDL